MGADYFLDSDVILDFLLNRFPFADYAEEIFILARNSHVTLYISPISISNIDYILKKSVGKDASLSLIREICDFCKILSVGEQEILEALKSDFSDFEDAIQYHSAFNHPEIKGIITRNTSDYRKAKLPVFTPESFLGLFK